MWVQISAVAVALFVLVLVQFGKPERLVNILTPVFLEDVAESMKLQNCKTGCLALFVLVLHVVHPERLDILTPVDLFWVVLGRCHQSNEIVKLQNRIATTIRNYMHDTPVAGR